MDLERYIRALPKTDLHVHLDGSLRIPTLIELAQERHVELPSYTVEGLRETVFKDRYANLNEYLLGFQYTLSVMRDPEALERIAFEFAEDNFEEGVRYFEVRFAPQLHVHEQFTIRDVLQVVNRGLARAAAQFNARIAGKAEPLHHYGITVCALRFFDEASGPYYADLMRVHPFSPRTDVYSMASLEMVQAAVACRDQDHIPITGFDLAGREEGFPAEDHRPAYEYAHKKFLKKTVHAGEAYGAESIFQAITDLHADRIGHGYYLLSPEMIKSPTIRDKAEYVRALAEYIADRRITIEVCLTSNLQTNPNLKSLADHAFKDMRQMRLSTTICTDNRLMSHTTVTDEYIKAIQHFNLTAKELRNIVIYGFKRSFFPGSYIDKRAYVRSIIDYYERVESAFVPRDGTWTGDAP